MFKTKCQHNFFNQKPNRRHKGLKHSFTRSHSVLRGRICCERQRVMGALMGYMHETPELVFVLESYIMLRRDSIIQVILWVFLRGGEGEWYRELTKSAYVWIHCKYIIKKSFIVVWIKISETFPTGAIYYSSFSQIPLPQQIARKL